MVTMKPALPCCLACHLRQRRHRPDAAQSTGI